MASPRGASTRRELDPLVSLPSPGATVTGRPLSCPRIGARGGVYHPSAMQYPIPTFFTLSGGQTGTFPGGIHTFSINVQSGAATVNGTSFSAPILLQGGSVDSKMIMSTTGRGILVSGNSAGALVGCFYL